MSVLMILAWAFVIADLLGLVLWLALPSEKALEAEDDYWARKVREWNRTYQVICVDEFGQPWVPALLAGEDPTNART